MGYNIPLYSFPLFRRHCFKYTYDPPFENLMTHMRILGTCSGARPIPPFAKIEPPPLMGNPVGNKDLIVESKAQTWSSKKWEGVGTMISMVN